MKGNIKRIGLVLLTLLTLSLGTLVVNAETKDSDFVIENGVLKQYKGNDDTHFTYRRGQQIASDTVLKIIEFTMIKGHMHLKMIIIFCLLINFVQERLFYHQR